MPQYRWICMQVPQWYLSPYSRWQCWGWECAFHRYHDCVLLPFSMWLLSPSAYRCSSSPQFLLRRNHYSHRWRFSVCMGGELRLLLHCHLDLLPISSLYLFIFANVTWCCYVGFTYTDDCDIFLVYWPFYCYMVTLSPVIILSWRSILSRYGNPCFLLVSTCMECPFPSLHFEPLCAFRTQISLL